MNMFEEARTLRDMAAMCHLTQSEIADKLNVSQSYIANKIRLLQLSESLQQRILAAGLSERHARALLPLDEGDREHALDKIIEGHLNVAVTEAVVDGMLDRKKIDGLKGAKDSDALFVWEEVMDTSLLLLRKRGVTVEKKVEKYGERTYYTIMVG